MPTDLPLRPVTSGTPSDSLRALRACSEGVDWAESFATPAEAFAACPRADWLLWVLHVRRRLTPAKSRLFACWCVRHTPLPGGGVAWDLLCDARSRRAVEVAEHYANGRASDEERASAWEAATWAATTAWAAGSAAESSAAAAAAWAVSTWPAETEWELHRAVDSAATAAGGTPVAMQAQADALRSIYGNPYDDAVGDQSVGRTGPGAPASRPSVATALAE
jgi:hypothetical protein